MDETSCGNKEPKNCIECHRLIETWNNISKQLHLDPKGLGNCEDWLNLDKEYHIHIKGTEFDIYELLEMNGYTNDFQNYKYDLKEGDIISIVWDLYADQIEISEEVVYMDKLFMGYCYDYFGHRENVFENTPYIKVRFRNSYLKFYLDWEFRDDIDQKWVELLVLFKKIEKNPEILQKKRRKL